MTEKELRLQRMTKPALERILNDERRAHAKTKAERDRARQIIDDLTGDLERWKDLAGRANHRQAELGARLARLRIALAQARERLPNGVEVPLPCPSPGCIQRLDNHGRCAICDPEIGP
jgi:hypothetical protein